MKIIATFEKPDGMYDGEFEAELREALDGLRACTGFAAQLVVTEEHGDFVIPFESDDSVIVGGDDFVRDE